ncbi:MAG: hypothetical protein ACTSYZ_01460 [Candidatus Helarchaeota archaeon]
MVKLIIKKTITGAYIIEKINLFLRIFLLRVYKRMNLNWRGSTKKLMESNFKQTYAIVYVGAIYKSPSLKPQNDTMTEKIK